MSDEFLDLRQIRHFMAVYEECSMSRAAVRENCTQPGLSVLIAKLEAQVSHKLFERKSRGVAPTAAGRHLYACCVEALAGLKHVNQRMAELSENVAGQIRVGVPPSFSTSVLPSLLPKFLSAYPFVDVHLVEAYSGTLSAWTVEKVLDAAIVTEPPDNPGLEASRFFRDRLLLVHGKTAPAPLRLKNGHVSYKIIVPSRKHSLRRAIDSHIESNGIDVSRLLEIDGVTCTIETVCNSDWVSILPSILVMDKVREGKLVAQVPPGPDLWLDFHIIQNRGSAVSPAFKAFSAALTEEVRNHQASQPKPRVRELK